ncbi:chemotaxis protein CheB [Chondrinema litorale]|uniref:chemotaxis protein CheB n=1 Tax=Chondrinema litorale TaxID=2994555 RepID=UPI002542D20D|nr:chemotaxis protein CheB [Chondrinema litorale]UZR98493.1 ATP-binding protein [Chondrinema litorale]
MAKNKESFLIVGIGASAGGLAALKTFVQNLPKETGMAFVIIQHLDPTHKSILSELLSKECEMPIKIAENNLTVKPDHIYVIPPDKYLILENRKIKLSKPQASRGSRKAIDHFFRSLARECGDRCAGIILSGSGSDGTAGLRVIRAAGGITLVQRPETAQHDSMPQSAIDANVVDKVVDIEEIPSLLKQYVDHPLILNEEEIFDNTKSGNLQKVASIIQTHENFNLHQYKPTTVQRRIARRISLTNCKNFKEYLLMLQNEETERQLLTKDLLINVTDFFRDSEAFEILEQNIIPNIFDNVNVKEDIRVWVAGCASGEEAYSIAILFLEAIPETRSKNHIKIFATDIDEHAIKIARKGMYPESIANRLPKKYIDKYFNLSENSHYYQIKNHVRNLISFAVQNVISDPPFNHMHLISCRNLLIYLNKEVQEKVLSSFYFSLEGENCLFLGSSETLGDKKEHFKTVSKKWRIYKKIPGRSHKEILLNHSEKNQNILSFKKLPPPYKYEKRREAHSRSDNMRRALLDTFLPPTVIVDEQGQILYNHGDWKAYLNIPTGEPLNNIIELVVPALRSRLRSALFKVKKTKDFISFHGIVTDKNTSQEVVVRVEMAPIYKQEFVDGLAIGIVFHQEHAFDENQKSLITQTDENTATQNLERELAETKEELQNTIEELETHSEELKTSHEEALSTTEELQSANEELEASSEELRSLNEELSTVNAELKEKIEALQKANDDVENFFDSTNLPTIFLDPDLKIQRYTPAAEQLLKMGPQDLNRPISALGRDLLGDVLYEDCRRVLKNFQPIRTEIQSYDKRWYIRQITPYRTEDRRIEGVVLVFQDVTDLKVLSQRAETREKQQSVVAELGLMALSGAEPHDVMNLAVRQVAFVLGVDYCKVLKYQPEQKNFLLVSGIGWQEGMVGKATIPANQNSQAGFTLSSQKPIIVKKLLEERRFSGPSFLLEHQVVSGMSCLINHTNPPYGILGVHTKTYREFTEYDTHFIVSIANMLSTALKTKEAQKKISDSENKLRMAMETNSFGSFEYSLLEEKTQWDQLLLDIWGIEKHEKVTQQMFWEGLHPDDYQMVKENLEKATDKNSSGHYNSVYRVIHRQTKELRWVEASGQTIFENGKPIKMIGMIIDITERKQLEESLQKAVSELKDSDQKKNEFLAILGHELRNPLSALNGSIEILEMNMPESNQIFEIIKNSIQKMSQLLDDLLDLNRVSQNKIELNLKPISLRKILENIVNTLKKDCEEKKQTIELNTTSHLYVVGDALRLDQVFSNLITNACKYSPEKGEIKINVEEIDNEIHVHVQDTGMGLDKEMQEKIFEPFFQITQKGKAASGLGIGLALSKKLVELHGGRIKATSKGKNMGSTFTVILRAHKQKHIEKAPEEKKVDKLEKGLKVLLIEDNEDILITMSMLLKKLGCKVQTAKTGKDGLISAKEFTPDAVLIDIGLPDISGHETAKILRQDGYKGFLTAVSGYSHEEAMQKSKESGFNYHLPKPASISAIARLLAKAKKEI